MSPNFRINSDALESNRIEFLSVFIPCVELLMYHYIFTIKTQILREW